MKGSLTSINKSYDVEDTMFSDSYYR